MSFTVGGFGFTGAGSGGGGGGIAAVTANNGITANTISNVQLGGTLIQDTTIDTVGFFTKFSGTKNGFGATGLLQALNSGNSPSFYAQNDGSGNAIKASSFTNIAGYFQSTSALAGYFLSQNSIALGAQATGSYAIQSERLGATSNSVLGSVNVFRGTTAPFGLNGIGASLDFSMAASNGGAVQNTATRLISTFTDATVATLSSRFSINNANSAVDQEQLYLTSVGQLGLNKYGTGAFTGTVAYVLSVTSAGAVIESSLASIINMQNAYDGGNTINGFTFLANGTDYIFGTTSGTITSGADILAFGFKAADQSTGDSIIALGNTAASLNSGSNVNAGGTNAAVNNIGSNVNAFGNNAGADNGSDNVNMFGNGAGNLNTGRYLNAFGPDAGLSNGGINCNFFGIKAGEQNTGSSVNCFGPNTGSLNSGDNADLIGAGAGTSNSGADVVAVGREAGWDGLNGNTLSNVFIISNNVLQSFASHAAAATAFAGGVAGNTYLYFNSATNQISGVRL